MKTDDLIGVLAADAGPAGHPGDARRLVLGLLPAFGLAVATVAALLGLLPPEGWGPGATGPKLVYGAAVAGAGIWLLRRLGRPGSRVAGGTLLAAGVFGLVAVLGLADIARTAPPDRMARLMGHSALTCPLLILGLSLPSLAATLAALRRLAPVRLQAAGAAAGLAAGGVAAVAYALACTEGAPAFIAVWYSMGIVLSAALGALAGPRVLRW